MIDLRSLAATRVLLDWRYDGRLKFETVDEVIQGDEKSFVTLNGGSSKENGNIYAEGRSFEERYDAVGYSSKMVPFVLSANMHSATRRRPIATPLD
jgi:hypothetical protein